MGTDTHTEPGTEVISLAQVEDVLLHGGDIEVVSDDDIQRNMVAEILGAGSLEQAFAQFTTVPLDDILQSPIEVQGVAWRRSTFEDGPKVYAMLRILLLDGSSRAGKKGETVTVSMGGKTTMAAFVWAQRHAAMPFKGSFHREQSRSNANRSFIVFKLA
jgi:hypothetical protein